MMLKSCKTLLSCGLKTNVAAPLMQVAQKHTLPELGYDYAALEPIICREIMELHHSKHHQAYVTNFNAAEEQLQDAVAKNDTSKIISLGNAIRFNGGGHINHSIFWQNLTAKTTTPSKALTAAIEARFGNMENFKKEMTAATVAVQGSGWGWLGYNKKTGMVDIAALPNQDPLEASTGMVPLFGIDVWEHAYYIQYKNVRPTYVQAIWDIANWEDVSKRFEIASGKK